MKYYAVIDTNVLISAMLKFNSVPGTIIELVFNGIVIPVLNEEILKEYEKVLKRPKFHFTNEIIMTVIEEIKKAAIYVNEEKINIELPDIKDTIFYEVVMEERKVEETYLVTGNIKHFPLQSFIVTPRQFIDIIVKDII